MFQAIISVLLSAVTAIETKQIGLNKTREKSISGIAEIRMTSKTVSRYKEHIHYLYCNVFIYHMELKLKSNTSVISLIHHLLNVHQNQLNSKPFMQWPARSDNVTDFMKDTLRSGNKKIQVFWNVVLCPQVNSVQCFKEL
jgi:hypothetical protein